MSGNKWWPAKVGSKLLSDSVIFFNTFFWHSIRFPQFNPSKANKKFDIFLAGINTNFEIFLKK